MLPQTSPGEIVKTYTVIVSLCTLLTVACNTSSTAPEPLMTRPRENTVMCIGAGINGEVLVVPSGSNGECPLGFDLKPWT